MASRPFFAGLLTAQAIAVVHVRLSNIAHYHKIQDVLAAGYLAVPGAAAAEALKGWWSAWCGGLFFTLTVGAGLTLAAVFALRCWRRDHGRVPWVRIGMSVLWMILAGVMNANGCSAAATAYILLIPLAVIAAARHLPDRGAPTFRIITAIHVIGLVLLAGIGIQRMNTSFFTAIRDRLLLSGAIGVAVNNAYYRHTLYAAQAFKSLDQELIRTCRIVIGPEDDPTLTLRLKRRLARLDWLVVAGRHPADMVIRGDAGSLGLLRHDRHILTVPAGAFVARPEKILKAFSAETDRTGGLRWFTFLSLMIVCLVVFYAAVYFPAHAIAARMLGPGAAAAASVAIVVIAGGMLMSKVEGKPPLQGDDTDALKSMIGADDAGARVAGLIDIYQRKLDVGLFLDPRQLAGSPDLRERYWLARVLPFSRHPGAFSALSILAGDPQINVAYHACRGIGLRGERRGIAVLLRVIARTREWYVQLYAYNALKRLGWHQTGSG